MAGNNTVSCRSTKFRPHNRSSRLSQGQLQFRLRTDREMAYGIMGSTQNSFLSTYRTTRPVKCLYFDGASGALGENGTMDMQMLFLYGNTTGPPGKHSAAEFLWNEYARAQHFCEWLHENDFDNPGRGIEGIVRMSAGFEVIWCNFSSPSIQLVSQLNASVPLLGHNRTSSLTLSSNKGKRALTTIDRPTPDDLPAPDWEIDWDHEPFVASQQWDWFTSISRTYSSDNLASARDLSTRLLAADVVSLYSPEFEKHLAALVRDEREHFNLTLGGHLHDDDSPESRRDTVKRLLRRRAGHRVGNISAHEIGEFRTNVKLMVTRVVSKASEDAQRWSAISWSHTSDMIVDNFAQRLMKLQQLLEEGEGSTGEGESQYSTRKSFASLRERAHALLMPFFEYSSHPEVALGSEKIQASLDRCKRQYLPPFTYQEQSETAIEGSTRGGYIGQAIEEVMHNICVVLVGMGNSIEMTWLQNFNGKIQNPSKEQQQTFRVEIRTWHRKIEELTAWLGWAPHWMGCDRLCEWDVSGPDV